MSGPGVSATLADTLLTSVVGGTTSSYAALATNDPGSGGTGFPSTVTTREAVTWGSPASGSVVATGLPSWSNWPSGSNGEEEQYLTFWSASTGGTFSMSMELNPFVTMATGDTLSVTSIQLSFSVIAS